MPTRDLSKSPNWYARYKHPQTGKRVKVSTRTTNKREATLIENELRAQAYKDLHSNGYGHKLFDDLMYAWLDKVEDRERDIYSLRSLTPHFQGRRLDQIAPAHVTDYKRKRKADGVTGSTVRKELLTFQAAINWVNQECDWNIPNPIKGLLPPKGESRMRWIRFEEYHRLLDSCSNKAPYLADMITLAVNTGMRSGEIKKLTWDRVDLAHSIILLEPGDQKKKKHGSIALNTTARRLLARLFSDDAKYVFSIEGKPIGSIKRSFATACRRAEIEDFVFHDLRHTCASWLVQAGAGLAKVQEVLRHSDIRQTMIYAHLAPEDAIQTVEILDKVVPQVVPKVVPKSGTS